MTCEPCVCVVVCIVIVYFCTIFSGAADRLVQKCLCICWIIQSSRSLWWCVKLDCVQLCRLWQFPFVKYFLVYLTGWPELDTLTYRLTKKSSCVESYENMWKIFEYRYPIVTIAEISSGIYVQKLKEHTGISNWFDYL